MSFGGGFMNGSQPGSSPSGGGGKKAGSSALRPVTIHQVISAQQAFGDAEFMIDGSEVKDVTLVACIRSVNITTTQATFLIEDGTGQIDCRMWIENGAGEEGEQDSRLSSLENNRYVRILGSIKTFSEKRHISAQRVRPITDMNEISFHLIECAYVHKYITLGPPGGGNTSMVTDRPYDGAGGNPYAADGGAPADAAVKDLPHAQREIWKFVREELDANPEIASEGVNINSISRHVGMGVEQVREMVAVMVEDGVLYDGLDLDHYLITN
ncbi:Rfa2p [Sporobolomyces salmoneus]|uniref:Rfa2p n=1 Tax=Sporobolomyces salmoneus TaxID=183962 RepID=UPI00316C5EDA